MTTKMIIKNNLRYYMGQRMMSQKQLSQVSGICKQTISTYYNGHATPSPDRIKQLAQALKIQPDQLLEERKPAQPAVETSPVPGNLVDLRITVVQAAACMKKPQQFIRKGLQTKTLQFGAAIKMESHWSYYISPEKFREFVGPQRFDTFFGIA